MHENIPLLLVIFFAAYALIASEKVDKTIAAGLGAGAVIILHLIPYEKALHHIDLNVIFLLIGMMMIVNILSRTGMFEWLATIIAKFAKGNALVILMLFLVVTAILSSLLDNVTTVILIAPITILICQILELPAVPFLIFEALFSNIGGTATLVGDPPNVLIGSKVHLNFNEFIIHLGPAVAIIMVASIAAVYLVLGRKLKVRESAKDQIMKTQPALAIIDHKNMYKGLIVFALVLSGFFLGHAMHVEPGIIALVGGLLMAFVCGSDIHHVLGKVEWNTILFFIGLFMLVGALQENGIFIWLGNQVINMTQGNLLMTAIVVLWVSAIASAVVDNIPLVIAMIPLIEQIVPVFAQNMGYDMTADAAIIKQTIQYPLFWSLALGACLGGNGSLVGASANVVIAQVARRNKYNLSFWSFTKYGAPMMFLSLILSTIYIWLRYF